eukprot:TRINITY_DN2124_c0_g1_i1.p1 TRINITY_DN2124_c0_g1~~TRINITY_DN2124_c0_g1_i1.p1  ORF type:complete len:529 (-),score=214.88 TRINITY_DN2124_c0_g1_i1:57-1643(-)
MPEISAPSKKQFKDTEKEKDVRQSCIVAAKAVADAVRTSLGPRGMDKMIVDGKKNVVITNDGATILKQMNVIHPAAKMLVELSKAQDIEAGDGTTSVVVICGAFLKAALDLLDKGIHATIISDAFQACAVEATKVLEDMATPVELSDRESLISAATTSLNSKVVSQYSELLSPISVDAVLRVIDPASAKNVELNDIKVVTTVGGTIDDTELVDGIVFPQGCAKKAGGPIRMKDAKIALIQFCVSAPKTDLDNSVVINDYVQMDRLLREERKYILKICRTIQKSGANVVLIQKSILRDAYNDMALHFFAKLGIMVIHNVEREDIEFICKGTGCLPMASIEAVTADKLGRADLVEEVTTGESKVVKVTGIPNAGKIVSVICRASNQLVLEEVGRSLHDALCVVRSIVKKPMLITGGGAPEVRVSQHLMEWSKTLGGMHSYCARAYAEALEVVPYTLAENAGLPAIKIVTELRNRHRNNEIHAGVNVKKGGISDIREENVIQPLLVSHSAMTLATETVQMLLKIDDIVGTR